MMPEVLIWVFLILEADLFRPLEGLRLDRAVNPNGDMSSDSDVAGCIPSFLVEGLDVVLKLSELDVTPRACCRVHLCWETVLSSFHLFLILLVFIVWPLFTFA